MSELDTRPSETEILLRRKYGVTQLMGGVVAQFHETTKLLPKSNLGKDLLKLKKPLLEVQSYVCHCLERNQVPLLKEIEKNAYELADILDEVAYKAVDEAAYEKSRNLDAAPKFSKRRKSSRSLSSSSKASETKELGQRLDELNSALQKLSEEATKIPKLRPGVFILGSESVPSTTQLQGYKDPFAPQVNMELVGRSEVSGDLVNMLTKPSTDEDGPVRIIPLLGEYGVGKTTLARAVYEHKQIKDHFDLRMWVCVSESLEAKWVLGKILGALVFDWRVELESTDEILALLLEELGGRSFFLVLDDVSVSQAGTEKWNVLKECLLRLNTTRRNKVLTTSRREIVEKMGTNIPVTLQELSDDHCKVIFHQNALKNIPPEELSSKDMEAIKNKMGKWEPLAAKVLGSLDNLSRNRQTIAKQIDELLNTDFLQKEGFRKTFKEHKDGTLAALILSFLHLPLQVQQCFTYMSMFPSNTSIEKDNIIQLWMAQGFLQVTNSSNDMEDIGESCLNILMHSCLIEADEWDFCGKVSSVKLPTVLRHFALRMLSPIDRHSTNHAARPLVQTSGTLKLLTFFSVENHVNYSSNNNFGSLRVLSLRKSEFKEWPLEFDKLIHLRYLDVSETRIKELPESISQLIHLQTVRATNCPYLERLPTDVTQLRKLRHLCIDADNEAIKGVDVQMPRGLKNLTSIQTLPLFVVSSTGARASESLEPLKKLRGKLTICNLEHMTREEAEACNLKEKVSIQELRFEWNRNSREEPTDQEVLEKLLPSTNMKGLTLHNFGGIEIPMWNKANNGGAETRLLKNLVRLRLSSCYRCEILPALGTLPSLTELHIEGLENLVSIGSEFYTDIASGTTGAEESKITLFPALKKLSLMYLSKLNSWSKAGCADNLVFPVLQDLRVEGCVALSSAPSHFQSLKKLHVENISSGEPLANICSNLTTLTSIFISSVADMESLPEGILRDNSNLSFLRIWYCPKFTNIPSPKSWSCSNSLHSLCVYECAKLVSLPDNLNNITSLRELIITQCNSLKSIPSLGGLTSLRRLKIEWCKGLESLPSGLASCTSLEHLTIKGCSSLTFIQGEGLSHLTSLCSLNILGCDKLTSLPLLELHHYLTKLKKLEFEGFTEEPLGLTIEYPGLSGWVRFKALPEPFQTQMIKGTWSIDPKLLHVFATKAVGFLEAMRLFASGVQAIRR